MKRHILLKAGETSEEATGSDSDSEPAFLDEDNSNWIRLLRKERGKKKESKGEIKVYKVVI